MPKVGMKKFPYTVKGEKDAKMEAMRVGKKVKKKPAKKKPSMIRKKGM
jgi:hypothetical protein